MSSSNLGVAFIESLDDDALARLAERLAPLIADRLDPSSSGRLLTAKEVGERLGLHERTVSRMAAEGRLEGRKVGRGWRFDPDHLDVARRARRDLGSASSRRRGTDRGGSVAAAIRGTRT